MQLLSSLLFSLFLISTQACKVQKETGSTISNSTEAPVTETSSSKGDTYPVAMYTAEHKLEAYSQAIFAGGCFWCTEAAFERIDGVIDVISGYSGGHVAYPSYGAVGAGKTGHTEAIYIYYDSKVISYETLLDVLFVAHDPTTLNRQGPDYGEEYRSAIYFQNEAEQQIIDSKIKALNNSDLLPGKIVTEVAPYKEFWVAETYHQNYYAKVKKVLKAFPELIKIEYR